MSNFPFRSILFTSLSPHLHYIMAAAAPATAMKTPATLPIMVAAALELELRAALVTLEPLWVVWVPV
jgi:hypothetical protein